MRSEEFAALAKVERDHWFYRGKRDLVWYWLERLGPPEPDDVLIDVGAGTGQLLLEAGDRCRALGVEASPHGVRLAAHKRVTLVQASIDALPVASDVASAVTALDVIEHVDDDAGAVAELARIARPGGLIFIHVPAFQVLWSDWDEALGHRRRYTRPAVHRLLARSRLSSIRCVYVNSAAFLPIAAYRWWRRWRPARGARWEDRLPAATINRVLHTLFVAPARVRWLSPPFGLSIFCIARKPDNVRVPSSGA